MASRTEVKMKLITPDEFQCQVRTEDLKKCRRKAVGVIHLEAPGTDDRIRTIVLQSCKKCGKEILTALAEDNLELVDERELN